MALKQDPTPPTDVADVPGESAAFRAVGSLDGRRTRAYQVIYRRAAQDAAQAHARSDLTREVGGVLLGAVHRDELACYLLITHAIPALAATGSSTQLTFTAEAWAQIHQTIDRDHPGARIVGWYHTHPGFGVFLSEMDHFIHRHFFGLPHHVAVVIDPVAGTQGTFLWRAGRPHKDSTLIEEDSSAPAAPAVDHRRRLAVLGRRVAILIASFAIAYVLIWALLAWIDRSGGAVGPSIPSA